MARRSASNGALAIWAAAKLMPAPIEVLLEKDRGASQTKSPKWSALSMLSMTLQSMTSFCSKGARPIDEADRDLLVRTGIDRA